MILWYLYDIFKRIWNKLCLFVYLGTLQSPHKGWINVLNTMARLMIQHMPRGRSFIMHVIRLSGGGKGRLPSRSNSVSREWAGGTGLALLVVRERGQIGGSCLRVWLAYMALTSHSYKRKEHLSFCIDLARSEARGKEQGWRWEASATASKVESDSLV